MIDIGVPPKMCETELKIYLKILKDPREILSRKRNDVEFELLIMLCYEKKL